jgi:hypothetical protein
VGPQADSQVGGVDVRILEHRNVAALGQLPNGRPPDVLVRSISVRDHESNLIAGRQQLCETNDADGVVCEHDVSEPSHGRVPWPPRRTDSIT